MLGPKGVRIRLYWLKLLIVGSKIGTTKLGLQNCGKFKLGSVTCDLISEAHGKLLSSSTLVAL